MKKLFYFVYLSFFLLGNYGCTSLNRGLFSKRSPHELYRQKLEDAQLDKTSMGQQWVQAAEQSLTKAVSVSIPYREQGYFAAERVQASTIRFQAIRGEVMLITVDKNPSENFRIFADLYEETADKKPKFLAYADTSTNRLSYDVDKTGMYVLRLQPELLTSGEYTLSITTGPSLSFPVKGGRRKDIQSFFGADRDAGERLHEGIDIFASFRTPALAAANGIITRVTLNKLGGKVVFLHPGNKDYSLYYAHLDSQTVKEGQLVTTGDTVGLVGKTGNAIHTHPHLHFGIYTANGAVDPFPFVNPDTARPAKIIAEESRIGKIVRTERASALLPAPDNKSATLKTLPASTLCRIDAATGTFYKTELPDGTVGFIKADRITGLSKPLDKHTINSPQILLDKPNSIAAQKYVIPKGQLINILGNFNDFWYVDAGGRFGWMRK